MISSLALIMGKIVTQLVLEFNLQRKEQDNLIVLNDLKGLKVFYNLNNSMILINTHTIL